MNEWVRGVKNDNRGQKRQQHWLAMPLPRIKQKNSCWGSKICAVSDWCSCLRDLKFRWEAIRGSVASAPASNGEPEFFPPLIFVSGSGRVWGEAWGGASGDGESVKGPPIRVDLDDCGVWLWRRERVEAIGTAIKTQTIIAGSFKGRHGRNTGGCNSRLDSRFQFRK